MTEPIQTTVLDAAPAQSLTRLSKIIGDLFVLWKQTMYPGMDKYFVIDTYIPEGDIGAWLRVEDTRSKRTFPVSIAEMLLDIDHSVWCRCRRGPAVQG